MTIVTKREKNEHPGSSGGPPPVGDDGAGTPDGEGVVGLGDEHVSGVESLCIGESQ